MRVRPMCCFFLCPLFSPLLQVLHPNMSQSSNKRSISCRDRECLTATIIMLVMATVFFSKNVYPMLFWNKLINQRSVFLEPQHRQSTVISESSTQQQLKQTAGGPPATGDQW